MDSAVDARPSPSAASGTSAAAQHAAAAADRFSLLLLEEGEYYFKGHTAYHWIHERKR